MIPYLLQRALGIIPTLIAMTLITFVTMHAIPGSPFDPAASVRWEQPQARVLPTLALGLGRLAIFARYTRAGMLDELASDNVRTARAKGLSERAILYGHVLKAALLPIVTVAGPTLAAVGTGSFLVETIFSVPQKHLKLASLKPYIRRPL